MTAFQKYLYREFLKRLQASCSDRGNARLFTAYQVRDPGLGLSPSPSRPSTNPVLALITT